MRKGNNPCFVIVSLLILFFFFSLKTHLSIGADTISVGQSLSADQTIVSKGEIFELGFFSPGNNSNDYFIGIWYKKISPQTIVWVANRDAPLPDLSSSELKLLEDGNLVLFNKHKIQFWSTNLMSSPLNSTIVMLLDNGNLVLRSDGSSSSNVIWQSFDNPTNTWLPGAKLGLNKLTNMTQRLTSWMNSRDPRSGIFSLEIDPDGSSQFFLQRDGYHRYFTSGTWNGHIFSLIPEMRLNYIFNYSFVTNEREAYFTYSLYNTSIISRCVLDFTGQLKVLSWLEESQEWALFWSQPKQLCDMYFYCESFVSCNQKGSCADCSCLEGFEQRSWMGTMDLDVCLSGCERKTPLKCDNGGHDTFFMMPNMKLPKYSNNLVVWNKKECEFACLSDCSCTAYVYDGRCLVWYIDLFNLISNEDGEGVDLHVRIAVSEAKAYKDKKKIRTICVVSGIAGVVTFLGIVLVVYWNCTRREFIGTMEGAEDFLVLFRYKHLQSATNNFSEKLGEGGFGSVYRGKLNNSIDIAVKKLECLGKAEKQFRMEVSTLGMIQHANLVRLRGFCAQGSKRLLVYDYMPNGSLNSILFQKHSNILDWKTRYQIALGTARGLVYLHEKCRDCIIHCDIKPENILLDAWFSPRIADFGLAKLFGRDFSQVLTTMRGTRGYLAPEWISGVPITPKADVYSYGMTLFEIISGRRNLEISGDEMLDYFPTLVMSKVHNVEDVLSLLDHKLEGNANVEELTRACRVACWCIHNDEKERPTMGHVVQILEGVLEVGIPPIPEFFQPFVDKLVLNEVSEESSLQRSSQTCSRVSTASSTKNTPSSASFKSS